MKLAANRKVQLTVALVLTVLAVSGEGTGTVMVQASLAPKSAVVMVGRTQPLTFNPGSGAGSTLTGWVNLVAGGNSTVGTIDANGLYTAPAVPPSPNTVKILVRSGTMTAAAVLTILNPAPSISSVTPTVTMAGSENTMVTVRGAGFTPQSVIKADGTTLTTTFISNNELTASIPATTLASTGVTQIQVSTPAPGGGKSAQLPLTALSPGIVAGTANPQVATYTITSPRFANVTIEFGPDTSYGLRTWTQPTSTAEDGNNPCPKPHGECRGGTVSILVAGMKAFTTYHMRAIVDFPEGKEFLDSDHTFTTGGPDPSRLPKFNLVVPPGPGTTPGVVLYSMINTSGTLPGPLEFVATDMQGNVIWYYIPPDLPSAGAFPIKLLDNGHMLEGVNPTGGLREIDLAGNIIRELSVDDLNQKLQAAGFGLTVVKGFIGGMHHDFLVLPNGHLIVIALIVQDFTDLPGFPGTTSASGDAIVDLDQNLNAVWIWNAFDHLDINRHVLGFPDWTHGNALEYSPDDGNLLLSLRNQSWVIKIDYENGKGNGDILWHFGYQGDFTLAQGAPAGWQYGQHFPIFLGPNTTGQFRLGVWDNGNNRVLDANGDMCGTPGQPACYSRPVIFDVDENAKTAQIEWQDIRSEFSPIIGSIQELPNGDMFFDLGDITPPITAIGRIVEETKDSPPQVVWQLEEATGQIVYRAVHLPSLYPGVQW